MDPEANPPADTFEPVVWDDAGAMLAHEFRSNGSTTTGATNRR